MTAREKLARICQHFGTFANLPDTDARTERLLDAFCAEVLNEAADRLVEAAVDAPTTGQRTGLLNAITELRHMADAATPSSKEPQR